MILCNSVSMQRWAPNRANWREKKSAMMPILSERPTTLRTSGWGRSRTSGERVHPPQTRKSCHVRVGRVELRLVLDGQGGEMRVRRKITTPAHRLKEIEQNVRMTNSRVDKNRLRSNEPGPDTRASTIHVEGIVEYLRVRGDANEPQDRNPRKADATGPVHQRFPPRPHRPVPPEF